MRSNLGEKVKISRLYQPAKLANFNTGFFCWLELLLEADEFESDDSASKFTISFEPETDAIFKGESPPEMDAILSPVSFPLSDDLSLSDANEEIFKPFSDVWNITKKSFDKHIL